MTQVDDQPQQDVSGDDDGDVPSGGRLFRIMLEATAAGVERGLSMEDAVELASTTLIDSMPQFADTVTASLHQDKPNLMAWLVDQRAQLAAVIEARWGRALATYEAATYLSFELGGTISAAYAATQTLDPTSEVAFLLHGRACGVAGEVLCLMRSGFSDGATARRRTLHEIAVVMSVITENPGHDLAERYFDYAIIEQYGDMKTYQEHAAALGQVPFSADEVDELERQYNEVLTRRGPHFRKKHRWAAPLFPDGVDIQFGMLEEQAGLAHFQPYYRESNHYIHAGPRAALLNLYDVRGELSIGVGARADTDFGEVGHGSLTSLLQCTASLVARVPVASDGADELLSLMCLQRLTEDAGTAFMRVSRR